MDISSDAVCDIDHDFSETLTLEILAPLCSDSSILAEALNFSGNRPHRPYEFNASINCSSNNQAFLANEANNSSNLNVCVSSTTTQSHRVSQGTVHSHPHLTEENTDLYLSPTQNCFGTVLTDEIQFDLDISNNGSFVFSPVDVSSANNRAPPIRHAFIRSTGRRFGVVPTEVRRYIGGSAPDNTVQNGSLAAYVNPPN